MTAEKRSRFLSIINNETDRLSRLINDILDLTKIEAGKLSWHVTQVSLPEVIRTSVTNIQSLVDNKSLIMQLNISDPLPLFYGDRDRLVQVITNILSNAIKFTPTGGEITIKVGWTSGGGQYVSIRDNGPGIPQNILKNLFIPFYTTKEKGTGLGLPISQRIIENHGGTIEVRSQPGEGATFTVLLPIEADVYAAYSEAARVAETARAADAARRAPPAPILPPPPPGRLPPPAPAGPARRPTPPTMDRGKLPTP